MLSAVFCAIEEDNKTGLEELLAMANIDISQVRRGQYLPQSGVDGDNIYGNRVRDGHC